MAIVYPRVEYRHCNAVGDVFVWYPYSLGYYEQETYREGGKERLARYFRNNYGPHYEFRILSDCPQIDLQELDPWTA